MPLSCVILAGGLGKRMRGLTGELPKALIPVLGVPFADWQLRWLASQGVERVVYSIGHRGEMIRDHVGDGSAFGLAVSYVDEGSELRGTAGALRLALDRGALDAAFLVMYGDSFLSLDLAAVCSRWERSGLPALMTVIRNDGRWDASNAIADGSRVVLYDKRRPADRVGEMRWIDYGLSVLTRDVVAAVPPGVAMDLADVLHELSVAGRLASYEATERFYEVGSPQGLRDLEAHLAAVRR